jgi:hypothetical protein
MRLPTMGAPSERRECIPWELGWRRLHGTNSMTGDVLLPKHDPHGQPVPLNSWYYVTSELGSRLF